MPLMGFGTYGRTGAAGIAAISLALETGYRHLDTAQDYNTEREVGEAVRASGLARNEVFLTTKVATQNFAEGRLVPSLRKSCEEIGVDQVDLALIHWPSPRGEVPLATYLTQLAEAQSLGLASLMGVSNFTIALLEEAEAILGKGAIVNNQVELNPYITNAKLAAYCNSREISVTCYQPISKGRLKDDPVLTRIGKQHGASVEQVALAWEMARGYCAIPTSSRAERIRSNYEATRLSLAPDEIAAIDALDRGRRAVDPAWGPEWD
ncbi:2,5-diketo-D-gluconate reductase B [Devosia nitrariae]|uniref:2,5-diketo-D-gluconate reductase B n=2 Tax=Devosia nitrariae TaxID=2071872 RepID=A0ABQ5W4F7_9HYPH|nr:2,5-diketo-D-gluconate reductase B [Devosia nitrariae]